jgi:putative ABC transport system permease protein
MVFAIPIAWLQLIHQKVRFIVTLAGVAFVAILLFMQLGFQDALYESAVRVHHNIRGDIFLISPQYMSITAQQSFPRSRLYQALALDSVASVSPLYIQFGKLKNIKSGEKSSIFVFGIDPANSAFILPEVNQNLDRLKVADLALYDRDSRPEFGPIAENFNQGKPVSIEISPFNELTFSRRLQIAGLFSLGASFGVDGNLVVNYLTFTNMFLERTPDQIDVGIITLQPGTPVATAVRQLQATLPSDIRILDRPSFIQQEKNYWAQRTAIGFTFTLMVTMGFIVGVVFVYQILHGNIASHIAEFATLRAIGHTHLYLLSAIFQQAMILALLGYLPGIAISFGLYDLSRTATRLPMLMTPTQSLTVFISIFTMCFISGLIAIGKLRAADPADIF